MSPGDLVPAVPPLLATAVFAVIAARGWSGGSEPARVIRSAAFGVVLVLLLVAVQIAIYRHEVRTNDAPGSQPELGALVLAVATYLIVVPVLSVIGLRVLRVRPAWLVTLGAWGLLGCGLALISALGLAANPVPYVPVALLAYAGAAWVTTPHT